MAGLLLGIMKVRCHEGSIAHPTNTYLMFIFINFIFFWGGQVRLESSIKNKDLPISKTELPKAGKGQEVNIVISA